MASIEEQTLDQKRAFLNALRAQKSPEYRFTPSDAYTILGHGDEPEETFTVPENCIVIAKSRPGERTFRVLYEEYIKNLGRLPLEVTRDPLAPGHFPQLLEFLTSVAVYTPGEQCPNFTYNPFLTYPPPDWHNRIEVGLYSGLVKLTEEFRAVAGNFKTIQWNTHDYFAPLLFPKPPEGVESPERFFKYSVSPSEKEIRDALKTWETSTGYKMRVSNMLEELRDPRYGWNRNFTIDQKTLCAEHPGVYYNFACRAKPVSTKIYTERATVGVEPVRELPKGYLNLRSPKAGVAEGVHVPSNVRGVYLQAIQEAERSKRYMSGSKLNKAAAVGTAFTAIQNQSLGELKMALDQGFPANQPNEEGLTPLQLVLLGKPYNFPNAPQFVKALLERGADPNIPYPNGITPLFQAVTDPFVVIQGENEKTYPIVELLVQRDPAELHSPDLLDRVLQNSFNSAISSHPGVIPLVVRAGVAVPPPETLLGAIKRIPEAKSPQTFAETLIGLAEVSPDLGLKDTEGNTALHLSLKEPHAFELSMFLVGKAPQLLNEPNAEGDTPFALELKRLQNVGLMAFVIEEHGIFGKMIFSNPPPDIRGNLPLLLPIIDTLNSVEQYRLKLMNLIVAQGGKEKHLKKRGGGRRTRKRQQKLKSRGRSKRKSPQK